MNHGIHLEKKGFGRLTIILRLAEQQPMSVTTEIKLWYVSLGLTGSFHSPGCRGKLFLLLACQIVISTQTFTIKWYSVIERYIQNKLGFIATQFIILMNFFFKLLKGKGNWCAPLGKQCQQMLIYWKALQMLKQNITETYHDALHRKCIIIDNLGDNAQEFYLFKNCLKMWSEKYI